MMRLAIVCICYNSYDHLLNYIKSLHVAYSRCGEEIFFQLVIVDNSTDKIDGSIFEKFHICFPNLIYIKSENVGYFPGFKLGIDYLNILEFDYIAVSNVDLVVDGNFFIAINNIFKKNKSHVGIIAPSIFSEKRGGDINPKSLNKPGYFYLKKNIFLFSNKLVYKIYVKLSDLKVRYKVLNYPDNLEFYSPHGSFILFTSEYFAKGGSVNYPCFLFGEENFVAEECLKIKLKVMLEKTIILYDYDHGSTAKEPSSFILYHHIKSIRYILETYY